MRVTYASRRQNSIKDSLSRAWLVYLSVRGNNFSRIRLYSRFANVRSVAPELLARLRCSICASVLIPSHVNKPTVEAQMSSLFCVFTLSPLCTRFPQPSIFRTNLKWIKGWESRNGKYMITVHCNVARHPDSISGVIYQARLSGLVRVDCRSSLGLDIFRPPPPS